MQHIVVRCNEEVVNLTNITLHLISISGKPVFVVVFLKRKKRNVTGIQSQT